MHLVGAGYDFYGEASFLVHNQETTIYITMPTVTLASPIGTSVLRRGKIMRKWVYIRIFFLGVYGCSLSVACAGESTIPTYELTGKIHFTKYGESAVTLEITLQNTSGYAICVPNGELGRAETYSDVLVVRNTDGKLARYKGRQGAKGRSKPVSTYMIVPPGEAVSGEFNLSHLYKLPPGAYNVSYLIAVVKCETFEKGWVPMPSPYLLRHDFESNRRHIFDLYRELYPVWLRNGGLARLNPLRFEVK